jgi:predicted transcriptional regulator
LPERVQKNLVSEFFRLTAKTYRLMICADNLSWREGIMSRPSQDVTDAELAVLQALWDRGPATIRQISTAIYGGEGASPYATVQKLLERLEAKECVRRRRGANAQLFEAAIDRNELIGRRLRAVAETLCDGSFTPLLTHLVQTQQFSESDRRALRELVDRLDRPAASRPRSAPGQGQSGKGV